jgi:hypothetical protein
MRYRVYMAGPRKLYLGDEKLWVLTDFQEGEGRTGVMLPREY